MTCVCVCVFVCFLSALLQEAFTWCALEHARAVVDALLTCHSAAMSHLLRPSFDKETAEIGRCFHDLCITRDHAAQELPWSCGPTPTGSSGISENPSNLPRFPPHRLGPCHPPEHQINGHILHSSKTARAEVNEFEQSNTRNTACRNNECPLDTHTKAWQGPWEKYYKLTSLVCAAEFDMFDLTVKIPQTKILAELSHCRSFSKNLSQIGFGFLNTWLCNMSCMHNYRCRL